MSRAVLARVKRLITEALRESEKRRHPIVRKNLIGMLERLRQSRQLTEKEFDAGLTHLVATSTWYDLPQNRFWRPNGKKQ